ncbi:hypothetical protein VKT23_015876 [Stygiomarasmius scandens]|uniref:Uncharacterized protein n=1 Tax=Marasmiellus scandens TaxID=2682957 RepID=A0ABR1IWY8_9AGAR
MTLRIPEIPAYVAVVSVCSLLLHAGVSKFFQPRSRPADHREANDEDKNISGQGRNPRIILASRTLKVLGCLVLLGLTIGAAIEGKCGSVAAELEVSVHIMRAVPLTCFLFAYASCLAILSLLPSIRHEWKSIFRKHLNVILLVPFLLYIYRDILPLGTCTYQPIDACEGHYLWTKIGVLGLTSVVLPLFTPREYIPADPNNPMHKPNPEQTCSVFSLLCIIFMDNVVFSARTVEHLAFEQLPPLGDWDFASTLRRKYFKNLDTFSGAPRRKLIWGILQSFWPAFIQMAIFMGPIKAFAAVLSPFVLNKLLKYLETGGENATVRPWVWILGLFLSPVLEAVSYEWFFRVAMHTEVRVEALIQQLVFEHALRMRVKNEVVMVAKPEETADGPGNVKPQGVEKDGGGNQNVYGKINNLVTTDLQTLLQSVDVFLGLGAVPLELVAYGVFLYSILGWSALVGIGIAILLSPIPTFLTKLGAQVQSRKMKKTDSRVQTFSDMVNVLRMVKLFGWEARMSQLIREKRAEELKLIRWKMGLDLGMNASNLVISFVTMASTFAVHSIVRKQQLTASVVFSSMAVFDLFGLYIHFIFMTINQVISAGISMNRITEFLQDTELLDEDPNEKLAIAPSSSSEPPPAHKDDIGFCNATFAWSKELYQNRGTDSGAATPTSAHPGRRFILQIEDKVVFEKDHLNLIVGPTASGKTALLMGLLGEMHFIHPSDRTSGESMSWVNLPREHGIAYAPQESWVLNQTIKDNIIFSSEFDEVRYKKVLYQCALERDLSLFKAGDQTEVGERGQTLSGGQKARLTLARAVYSNAQIVILDDVLAALDVHTSKWIVEKCFAGDLLEGRTVIMVTHNVDLVKPLARYIVTMKDGHVIDQDHISKAHQSSRELIMKLRKENDGEPKPEESEGQQDGKLVMDEEIAIGRVGLSSLKLYASGLSGGCIVLFFSLFFIGLALATLITTFQTWYLGHWAAQYEFQAPEDIPVL